MRLSFRKKFHLAASRPKNPDANLLFQVIRDEFVSLTENHDPIPPSAKVSHKALKAIQKNLVEIPVGAKLEVKLANLPLGEVGEAVLMRALPESKALRSLSLVKCGIDGESISSFSKLVHGLTQLDEVDFSGNTLSNSGANMLFSSLNPATPIPLVRLAGIGISDDGLTSLLSLLATTKTPFSVDLSHNSFTSNSIEKIIAAARKNIFVVKVDLDGSGMTDLQAKQLYEVCGRNEVVAAQIERLLVNACRRTFKSKLVNFRESVQQNRCSDDSAETSVPVYKWVQKAKSTNTIDIPSQRFQIGVCLDIGRRNEMQDVVAIKGMFRGDKNQDLFAVFDGHGGRDAATHCAERLPSMIAEYLSKVSSDPVAALKDSFVKCHKEMAPWSTMMGTTVVLVLILEGRRYVANLGDSKAILSQRGQLAFSTKDHKATDPEEERRIVELGGQVVNGRLNDKLSVSRALGDSNLTPFVTPMPEVFEQTMSKYDEFMVLASDGVWDVLTPEEVIRLIVVRQKKSSFKEPDAIEAKLLADLVKDEAYIRGSKDNISVMVILFPGFSRLKRARKKGTALILPSTPGGIPRSPSRDSNTSVLSDLDPWCTTSDSELAVLGESEEEDENFAASKLVRVAMDDSVLHKIKAQYGDLPTTPIANSFRAEMLGALETVGSKDGTSAS